MIDLHLHSTASDGSLTPAELVQKAYKTGLSAIALTDHDVIDGLGEFRTEAAKYPNMIALNGVELGVRNDGYDIEIIAMDIQDLAPFKQWQAKLTEARNTRMRERLEILTKLGMPITWEELAFDDKGRQRNLICKPHIAALMVQKGYVKDYQEAFRKYLAKGGLAYIETDDGPTAKETIQFIRDHGAVPVLAHPYFIKMKESLKFDYMKGLKKIGLMAAEIFHSEHTNENMRLYFQIVKELNLMASGGSDFHGSAKPAIKMKTGRGNLHIPDMLLGPILKRQKPDGIYYKELEKYLPLNFTQAVR